MAELAERAGIPAGVFNVVTGTRRGIGGELTTNPMVRKLSFTGSTEIGKQLMAQCAGTVKKVSLELGGHAPFIVFDDADLDEAVEGAIASQVPQHRPDLRLRQPPLVQDGVYDEFAAKLAAAVAELKVGRRHRPKACTQGPLIDMAAVEKVEEHIARRASQGRHASSPAASAIRSAAPSSSRPCSPTRRPR